MIAAVTVCVYYADYLSKTLPHLLERVDQVVVVTSHADDATRATATEYKVNCITTDLMYQLNGRPCPFNKGSAINAGLRALVRPDWILLVDADIALLDDIEGPLDERFLFGARRRRVIGALEWKRLQSGQRVGFPKATVHSQLPSGYFQLWHWPTFPGRYPENSGNASASDWAFAKQWPLQKIRMLPNMTAWHLEMAGDPYKANWHGRTTPMFQSSDEQPLIDSIAD